MNTSTKIWPETVMIVWDGESWLLKLIGMANDGYDDDINNNKGDGDGDDCDVADNDDTDNR